MAGMVIGILEVRHKWSQPRGIFIKDSPLPSPDYITNVSTVIGPIYRMTNGTWVELTTNGGFWGARITYGETYANIWNQGFLAGQVAGLEQAKLIGIAAQSGIIDHAFVTNLDAEMAKRREAENPYLKFR